MKAKLAYLNALGKFGLMLFCYAPPLGWGDLAMMRVCRQSDSDVCLSVAYIGPKSKREAYIRLKLAQGS